MKTDKIQKQTKKISLSSGLIERIENNGWTYIKTVVDVVHEPILVLNKNLYVITANEPFYRTFQVEAKDTEGKLIYNLGNGQWNIPTLQKLLEDILPKNTFFKGFEVIHKFPFIGHKVMILNARQIHFNNKSTLNETSSKIILLAIEDITEMISVAERFTDHVKNIEVKLTKRTKNLELLTKKLRNDLVKFKNS